MPLAMVMSSFVAAGYVGGESVRMALFARGIDVVLAPTTVIGRHPGWGKPGGQALVPAHFSDVIDGTAANGLFGLADLVIAGYFASPEQVEIAAQTIDRIREAPRGQAFAPRPLVIIDPIMGDDGKGLYVAPAIAAAIEALLVPRADLLCPNAWELGFLRRQKINGPEDIRAAARQWNIPVLCSSLPHESGVGLAWSDGRELFHGGHAFYPRAPNGFGDLTTGLFAASMALDSDPETAFGETLGVLAEISARAFAWNAPEAPLAACRDLLARPPRAEFDRIS